MEIFHDCIFMVVKKHNGKIFEFAIAIFFLHLAFISTKTMKVRYKIGINF